MPFQIVPKPLPAMSGLAVSGFRRVPSPACRAAERRTDNWPAGPISPSAVSTPRLLSRAPVFNGGRFLHSLAFCSASRGRAHACSGRMTSAPLPVRWWQTACQTGWSRFRTAVIRLCSGICYARALFLNTRTAI